MKPILNIDEKGTFEAEVSIVKTWDRLARDIKFKYAILRVGEMEVILDRFTLNEEIDNAMEMHDDMVYYAQHDAYKGGSRTYGEDDKDE